jgi:hypothetical protein
MILLGEEFLRDIGMFDVFFLANCIIMYCSEDAVPLSAKKSQLRSMEQLSLSSLALLEFSSFSLSP